MFLRAQTLSSAHRRAQGPAPAACDNRWMRLRRPSLGDEYTTGTFRDGIVMIVVILTVITALWLAYGWALGVPGVPRG